MTFWPSALINILSCSTAAACLQEMVEGLPGGKELPFLGIFGRLTVDTVANGRRLATPLRKGVVLWLHTRGFLLSAW